MGEEGGPGNGTAKKRKKQKKVKKKIFFVEKTIFVYYNCSMIGVKTMQNKVELPKGLRLSPGPWRIKSLINDASKRLSLLFWLIALHSFSVGWLLILHPAGLMHMFGFHPIGNDFFPVQGGVFHVLMSFFYLTIALRREGYRSMIYFSIVIKAGALVFLLSYYFFVEPILIVLISGVVDGVMAGVVTAAYHSFQQQGAVPRRSSLV